ncbi:MAG: putative lipid II flippase FtsW [Actinobacteria bacterium]|nr:putative lipid II flippase FtsW [Actinomycetota bacterium]MCI0543415.1 putative lipid II flippase FtsW [Actinomycetota bacterium]MCI0679324.1 putative lipid II flippase FtsW [Actinomycetota bacterium]
MTSNVTSISKIRAAARDRAERLAMNNRTATTLLVVVVVLLVIGLGATQSASSAIAIDANQDRLFYFKRQLLGIGVGTLALLVAARFPYRLYRLLAVPAFLVTLGLLVSVLVAGDTRGGATRWLTISGFSFQPSELAKISVVLVLALLLERKHRLLERFAHLIVPVAVTVGLVGVLIMSQPDLGTLIIVGAAAMAVVMTSDTPFRYVALISVVAVLVVVFLAFDADYRTDRITGFLDPYADAQGNGYQLIQGYYALGNGGIFGVGLGASRARWFYLPNAHTDFIFAIIGEETGLIGGLTIIGLFTVLALAGWVVAARAPDRFGRMLAAGMTAWLSFQALINIGGVLGVVPITGIALPFISFGSTAMVVSMAAVGILVNISQSGVRGGR